jgi:hypothetical protein
MNNTKGPSNPYIMLFIHSNRFHQNKDWTQPKTNVEQKVGGFFSMKWTSLSMLRNT